MAENFTYRDEDQRRRMEGYFRLVNERPELFTPSEMFPINADRAAMAEFEQRTGKLTGLVYDNYPFYYVVADLVSDKYAYARVIYPDAKRNGTVVIPRWSWDGSEPLFGILHVFRHAIHKEAGGEFPRGFMDPDPRLTERDNALKELKEELGIDRSLVTSVELIGKTRPDTGLACSEASVYLVTVESPEPPEVRPSSHEGIISAEWVSEDELLTRIRNGEITDGFTQSAMLMYLLK